MSTRYASEKARALTDPDLVLRDGRLFYLPGPHNASTYLNRRCRCSECKAAWAEAVRVRSARRADALAANPDLSPHGRVSTYGNWGCRCPACTDAYSAESVARARRRAERLSR